MRLLTNGFLSRFTKTGTTSRRVTNPTRKSFQLEWLRQVSSFETNELLDEFNTSRGGLSAEKVELSRAAWGSNEVTHVRRDSAPVRFAKAFMDPFTGILALLAVVSLFTDVILAAPADHNPSTFLIIFAMIAVSGILRFVQEGKSDDAAAALAVRGSRAWTLRTLRPRPGLPCCVMAGTATMCVSKDNMATGRSHGR